MIAPFPKCAGSNLYLRPGCIGGQETPTTRAASGRTTSTLVVAPPADLLLIRHHTVGCWGVESAAVPETTAPPERIPPWSSSALAIKDSISQIWKELKGTAGLPCFTPAFSVSSLFVELISIYMVFASPALPFLSQDMGRFCSITPTTCRCQVRLHR